MSYFLSVKVYYFYNWIEKQMLKNQKSYIHSPTFFFQVISCLLFQACTGMPPKSLNERPFLGPSAVPVGRSWVVTAAELWSELPWWFWLQRAWPPTSQLRATNPSGCELWNHRRDRHTGQSPLLTLLRKPAISHRAWFMMF